MIQSANHISEPWQIKFCLVLRESRSVTTACKAIQASRREVYAAREADPVFKQRWDDAFASNIDDLEASAMRRAIDGWDEPVFYKGAICGYKRLYSPTLTLAMLRVHRPEKYGTLVKEDDVNDFAKRLRDATKLMNESIPARES